MARWTDSAKLVLEQRYLLRDNSGKLTETTDQMLERVAKAVASAEKKEAKKWEREFLGIMDSLDFLPNSPTLMNAGTEDGQLSACMSGDTIVHTLQGDFTIRDLSERYSNGREFLVYSCDGERVVVGQAFNPRKTRELAKVYEITLGLGSVKSSVKFNQHKTLNSRYNTKVVKDGIVKIKLTEDHLVMLRDGTYKKVGELLCGDSVMPFNHRVNSNGYFTVYSQIDCNSIEAQDFIYAHFFGDKVPKGYLLHHVNGNRLDNDPENLALVSSKQHASIHMKNKQPMHNSVIAEKVSQKMMGNKNAIGHGRPRIRQFVHYFCEVCGKDFVDCKPRICCSVECQRKLWVQKGAIAKAGKSSWNKGLPSEKQPFYGKKHTQEWKEKSKQWLHNHRVISIKFVGCEDVYDLSVKQYHNFAANGIFIHNCYVLPIEDNLNSIFESVKQGAIIHKSGGGTGFSFSKIRPKGALVNGTFGVASGPVSFLRCFDTVTETVKQGGKRRGANLGCLSVYHPDIEEWITCKSDMKSFQNFNLSVTLDGAFLDAAVHERKINLSHTKDSRAKTSVEASDILNLICQKAWETGDPGILFIDTINRTNPIPWFGRIESSNPCMTGDTLVAVADGRGKVPIKQLADEGKDVPVHTLNGKGHIVVRMMRNPRLTGKNKPVYSVLLDNGQTVRVTGNHQFVLSDRSIKQTSDLVEGDSLFIMRRIQATFGKIIDNCESQAQDYFWLSSSNRKTKILEHRLIASFVSGKPIGYRDVVHHKDFCGLNNSPSNLQVMSKAEHDLIHLTKMYGDNNPMVRFPEKNIFNNKDWQREMSEKHHKGKKRSDKTCENIRRGVVKAFADIPGYRERISKGTKRGMQANRQKFDDAIKQKALKKLADCQSKTDLRCFLNGNSVMVEKVCEGCGTIFHQPWGRREIAHCGISCWNKVLAEKRRGIPSKDFVYSNHKVVSVTLCGYEDVYNGTVDDYHNLFIGGFDEEFEGSKSWVFVNTLQCGETPLLSWEACNLGSINLVNFVTDSKIDWKRMNLVIAAAMRFLDDVIDVNCYPKAKIDRKVKATRKVGLGVMGFADMLLLLGVRYDSSQAVTIAEDVMKNIQYTSHFVSTELGMEKGRAPVFEHAPNGKTKIQLRNSTCTTIAPTGTLSILADCSSGIEPIFAKDFSKTVLDGDVLPLGAKYAAFDQSLVVTAHDVSPEQHIKVQAAFQKYTDNAVSKTINLPKTARVSSIRNGIIQAYKAGCKGITFYRDGTRKSPLEVTTEGTLSECESGRCKI